MKWESLCTLFLYDSSSSRVKFTIHCNPWNEKARKVYMTMPLCMIWVSLPGSHNNMNRQWSCGCVPMTSRALGVQSSHVQDLTCRLSKFNMCCIDFRSSHTTVRSMYLHAVLLRYVNYCCHSRLEKCHASFSQFYWRFQNCIFPILFTFYTNQTRSEKWRKVRTMAISLRRSRRATKKEVSEFNVGDIVEVSGSLLWFVRFIHSDNIFFFWNKYE